LSEFDTRQSNGRRDFPEFTEFEKGSTRCNVGMMKGHQPMPAADLNTWLRERSSRNRDL
jgi:hypothetical protein